MRHSLALLALGFLAACSGTSTEVNGFVGSTDSALMAKLGAPDRESTGGDGRRFLSYNTRNALKHIVCSRNFVVDASHIVTSASHDCPF